MASSLNAGVFQTLQFLENEEILIHDEIYGDHTISERVIVELLRSPPLLRLMGVYQYGATGLLGLTPKVTRFEHSVGAFLLVRKVGASLEEQVAALLHDISHTTLSHTVDWALSKPNEESFHEVHKSRYIKTTQLPQTLIKHGFVDLKPFNEDLFPLVEMPSPHLCADRLDYSLRDAVCFGKLAMKDAQSVFASLKALPNASHPCRILVLEDEHLALVLARAYLATDKDVWSNPKHIDIYKRASQLIGDMIKRGRVEEEALWRLSDKDFWELLRSAADSNGLEIMKRLESNGFPEQDSLRLPHGTKIRTLDPDVCLPTMEHPLPLSVMQYGWALELYEYVVSREWLRV